VNFRDDGTAPDGSPGGGMPIQPGLAPIMYTDDLRRILFISPGGAILSISFYQVL